MTHSSPEPPSNMAAIDMDLMATLTEFTARSIALGLRQCAQLGPAIEEVVVAGGGVKNPALMERIKALIAPIPIRIVRRAWHSVRMLVKPWPSPSWPI